MARSRDTLRSQAARRQVMSADRMSDDRAVGERNADDEADDGKVLPTYQDLAAREGGPNSR